MKLAINSDIKIDEALINIKNAGLDNVIKKINSSLTYNKNNYTNENLRYLEVNGSSFLDNDFTKAAGTGSKFINCNFYGSKFIAADMEFVDFSNSKFLMFQEIDTNNTENALIDNSKQSNALTIIGGSGFNSCIMRNTLLNNVLVEGSSFAMSDFSNSVIKNSTFIHSTMEDSTFIDATIINTDMSQANIDFIDFIDIKRVDKLKLNINQVPYIFGLKISDIKDGNIELVNDQNEKVSYSNFIDLLSSLICLYNADKKYFPIANLYFIFEDYKKLNDIFHQGFKNAISSYNLRELKYFCKLLSICAKKENSFFTRSKLKAFYNSIIYFLNDLGDKNLLQQYSLFDGQIRSYLLDSNIDDEITFEINSKIDNISEATKQIDIFLDTTKSILKEAGIDIEFNNILISTYSNAKYTTTIKSIKLFDKPFIEIKNETTEYSEKDDEKWTSFQKISFTTTVALATMGMLLTGSIQLGYLDFLKKDTQETVINKAHYYHQNIKPYFYEDSLLVKQGNIIIADSKNFEDSFFHNYLTSFNIKKPS